MSNIYLLANICTAGTGRGLGLTLGLLKPVAEAHQHQMKTTNVKLSESRLTELFFASN